jgi:hypothetical protein
LTEDWQAERRANHAYEIYRARGVMRDGRKFGAPPKPYSPPEAPEGKLNTTDPDARRMKFGCNFLSAYNAQAVTTEDQIIVPAEITTKGGDFEGLDPIIGAADASWPVLASTNAPASCWPTLAIGQTSTSTPCASAG